jgi:hypothetical protein
MKRLVIKNCLTEKVINCILVLFLCNVVIAPLSSGLMAQDRFSLQVRPAVAFPISDLGDANLKTGFGFEGSMAYRFMPHTSAYAGWGWNKFSADQSFAGPNADFEETGYVFGLQFMHPFLRDSPFDYFVRAGVIVNHIEIEDAEGEIIADSGHGPGFQVETGLSFSLGDKWRLVPGIKYQSLSRDLELEGVSYPVDLNYFSLGLSVVRSF